MRVFIDEIKASVHETPKANIVIFESSKSQVKIKIEGEKAAAIRPLRLNISPKNEFLANVPEKLSVEFENEKPLFIFLYHPEKVNPDDYTYYFKKGNHNTHDITLHGGETIYVEYGAVLRAHIDAENAENIKISGHGIIDTSEIGAKKHRMIKFTRCKNVELSEVTLLGAIDWCVVFIDCEFAKADMLNIVTWEVNGDGVDVVGSKNIEITNCFFYTADDCVAIKATAYDDICGCNNVHDVRVSGCILWNQRPGNALEIGFETRCEDISNIIFSDCDVLHCEYEGYQSGGVFTIHNGDRAIIHDIIYKDIRIEDASQKLFDFKIFKTKYSIDETRGFIHDITAENISVLCDELPPSIIRSHDNEHGIKNVEIINLTHLGRKIDSMLKGHFIVESGSSVKLK